MDGRVEPAPSRSSSGPASDAPDSGQQAMLDPSVLRMIERDNKLDAVFRSTDPVEFMRSEELTISQVRSFFKTKPEYYARILNQSYSRYPLHHFARTSGFLNEDADDTVKTEGLGFISDLIRAFPNALFWQAGGANSGMTPLHYCAAHAKSDMDELCRLLVKFGGAACTMRTTKNGELPLHLAIKTGHWKVATILLGETVECGIDLSQEECPLIHLAIGSSAPPLFIEQLLAKVPGSARMLDKKGVLPLMQAIENNIADPSVLNSIIQGYPEALAVPDHDGNLPIHIAPTELFNDGEGEEYNYDYVEAVRVMIDGHPDSLSTPNNKGELPLHICAYRAVQGDIEEEMSVLRLVSDRHPEGHRAIDAHGNLPLHSACLPYSPSIRVVTFLAEQNESALSTVNFKGRPPLHLALYYTESSLNPVVKFLVEAFPNGLQTQMGEGNLALHACLSATPRGSRRFHSTELIHYLLSKCPESAGHANMNGSLPLHVACSQNLVPYDFIDLLVKFNPEGLSVFDQEGLLPFHRACLNDQSGNLVRKMFREWFQGLSLPLTAGGDPTHALFLACANGASLDVIKFLVEKSPDLFRAAVQNAKQSKK